VPSPRGRSPCARSRPHRAHSLRPPHPSLARAQKLVTPPLVSSKRLVSSVSSFLVNFTASMFSTWAPSSLLSPAPSRTLLWSLLTLVVDPEKVVGACWFLGIVFRLQHQERIVGCTGFPTDSHDTNWMEVNDDKGHHRCVECGHGAFAIPSRASQEL
jgi:hypothetical protein